MAGFRKSFLGFNCDDVVNYIQSAQAKFSKREGELNAQIEQTEKKLEAAELQMAALLAEKEALMAELDSFKSRCDEIEQLSLSIGKLYLVSQNSAKNIINNSVESSRQANEEIFKNIDSIENAHSALADIKESVRRTADNFISEVDALAASLTDTKQELIERNEDSTRQLEEFTAMYNKINNAE